MLFQNIVKRKKVFGTAVWEVPVWEQRPQIEDALPTTPTTVPTTLLATT
jgi:hypothetical protein